MPIAVKQLTPLFAGEVSGMDLRRPIDNRTQAEMLSAMDTYAALVFRGEKLSEDEQVAFSEAFGTLTGVNAVIDNQKHKRRITPRLADISNLDEAGQILDLGDR